MLAFQTLKARGCESALRNCFSWALKDMKIHDEEELVSVLVRARPVIIKSLDDDKMVYNYKRLP